MHHLGFCENVLRLPLAEVSSQTEEVLVKEIKVMKQLQLNNQKNK